MILNKTIILNNSIIKNINYYKKCHLISNNNIKYEANLYSLKQLY